MWPAHRVRRRLFGDANQLPDVPAIDRRSAGAATRRRAANAAVRAIAACDAAIYCDACAGFNSGARAVHAAGSPEKIKRVENGFGHHGGYRRSCGVGRRRLGFLFQAQGKGRSRDGKSGGASSRADRDRRFRRDGHSGESSRSLHEFDELERVGNFGDGD